MKGTSVSYLVPREPLPLLEGWIHRKGRGTGDRVESGHDLTETTFVQLCSPVGQLRVVEDSGSCAMPWDGAMCVP